MKLTDEQRAELAERIGRGPANELAPLIESWLSDPPAPSVFVQWKGTDLCADFYCTCGRGEDEGSFHVDAITFGHVTCPWCQTRYRIPHYLPIEKD